MLAAAVTAADVMSREVAAVEAAVPVRRVVETILGKAYGAVPVVERGRVVGIITGADLVERGGLGVRLNLLTRLAAPEQQRHLEALAGVAATAEDVMTRDPICVAPGTSLPEIALTMARRRLKRLPVVDGAGQLVGIVSRYDLLRTAAGGFEAADEAAGGVGLAADAPVSSVMRRDAPAVHPETPLPETLQAVVSTRLNLAVVVDDARRVVGLVSDAALLERITPALRPGLVRSLMLRLPFGRPRPEEVEAAAHARAHTAAELMSTGVPTVPPTMKLSEAIARMLKESHKLLAVTGEGGVLLGVVDRADLLRGIAAASD
jgi:CBS domain-containing protein